MTVKLLLTYGTTIGESQHLALSQRDLVFMLNQRGRHWALCARKERLAKQALGCKKHHLPVPTLLRRESAGGRRWVVSIQGPGSGQGMPHEGNSTTR